MFNILRDDLGLVKKLSRRVPKLLSEKQKHEHVWTCWDFITAVRRRSMSMLENTITMDETMVCYHTPETKKTVKTVNPEGEIRPHQG
jgi:hypothetical protein